MKRKRIGEVILDKAANVKTVVNKTGIIETQFRTFPMEILAGKDDMNVELKMNGFRFRFNFAKVYWNSRLSEEHERLVNDRFFPGDIVLDAFCGVGPFAVRAARKGCAVQANDLNPESMTSLVENATLNKVPLLDFRGMDLKKDQREAPEKISEFGKIAAFNADARDFLRFVFTGLPTLVAFPTAKTHVVMNLPATAPEFLDSLIGSIPENSRLPNIHCYCFSTAEDSERRRVDVIQRVKGILGIPGDRDVEMEVRDVRDVAPNKYMVCAHFILPEYVGYPSSLLQSGKKRLKSEQSSS